MANVLDPMDIKQIFSLHRDGLSNRKIAVTLGISRNTINQYISWLLSSDYQAGELLSMNEQELRELFPSRTTIKNNRYDSLMRYFENNKSSRNHPGFTFLHHYEEYRKLCDDPYSYTQFMEHFHRKYPEVKGSMKLEHLPGREVFMDFAGTRLDIIDKETGEVKKAEVFVSVLPFSLFTYVEACWSQKREDLIPCMNNMMWFMGGVPTAVVTDNLKSAVSRASKYEPEINRCLKEFARHYDCVINPTRTYSPQDKALVENAVQLTYQRIYYPLREMTFFSLEELNKEIRRLLEKFNNMLFQRKEASRRELFQSFEREELKPLPNGIYQLKEYRRAKVQKIGYVYFSPEKSYYSVPYRYIGKTTQIHYTKDTVEVYYFAERIAFHKRNTARGTYNTVDSHLCSTHQKYKDWSPDYFRKLASPIGAHTLACIEGLFVDSDYPETAYKRAMGIIRLARDFGKERLDKACERAVYAKSISYNRIKNILENNQDMLDFDPVPTKESHIPKHENIRGASKYK
jgi:transposase